MVPLGHSQARAPHGWHSNLEAPGQICLGDAVGSQHAVLPRPQGIQLPDGLGGVGLGGIGLGGGGGGGAGPGEGPGHA